MRFAALSALLFLVGCGPVGGPPNEDANAQALGIDLGMSRRPNFRNMGRRDMPAGSGSGTIGLRSPDWELRGDDAVFSGATMTSWPSVSGPSLTPVATREPQLSTLRSNSHVGVLFPTSGARAESTGTIRSGSHAIHSVIWIWDPETRAGPDDRRYGGYIYNNSDSADLHNVLAHSANQTAGFAKVGVFYGNDHLTTWRHVNSLPENRLHMFATVLDSDGTTRFYHNRTLLGSVGGVLPDPMTWTYPVIGGSYQSAGNESQVSQWFNGHIYHLKMWVGTSLTQTEIFDQFDLLSATYGFTGSEYLPSDNSSSLTLWLDDSGKRNQGGGQYTGAANCSQWEGRDPNARLVSQGTGGLYPGDGVRINGRPAFRFGSSSWFAGGYNVQGTLSAASGAAYSFMTVIYPRGITATQATGIGNRNVFLGDIGDYFSAEVFLDSGVASVSLYHYGGATYQVKDSGIALNTPTLVHGWYDGTNLNLRVGNRTAVSVTAANLGPAGNFRIGWGHNGSAKFDGDVPEVIFRNAANTTHMNQDRAYFGARYNIAY